jgi:hypothetical protein
VVTASIVDWLDDLLKLLPAVLMWRTYAVALWHTMRHPVTEQWSICRSPRACRRPHRLAMVFPKDKPGVFVLVH